MSPDPAMSDANSAYFHFVLILYVLGAAWAFALGNKNERRIRGLFPLCIGGALSFIIVSASATAQYASAAFFLLAFVVIAVPMVAVGLGLLCGSVALYLPKGGWGRFGRVALAAMPVLVALVFWDVRQRRIAAEAEDMQEQHAAFRLTNVEGPFAGVPISLPASPRTELYHDCVLGDDTRVRVCRTMFWTATGLSFQEGLTSPVVFHEIIVHPTDASVFTWCEDRPDLRESIWCTGTIDRRIEFSDEPPRGTGNGGDEIASTTEGLRIFCAEEQIGTRCESHGQVAASVYARFWTESLNPEVAAEMAPQAYLVARAIWDDISQQD